MQISIHRSSNSASDSFTNLHINKFRFYLSNFQFYYLGKPIETIEQNYLIHADTADKITLSLATPKNAVFDSLVFLIGIDSAKHEHGIQGGALDPLNGMYWTWQSGYINIKTEGTYTYLNNVQPFQWHIGGYRWPYSSTQWLSCRTQINTDIHLDIDLFKFVQSSFKLAPNNIMSPGKLALQLSNNFKQCILIQSASK